MPGTKISSKAFRSLEKQINNRLKEIGEGFAIRYLTQGSDGKFCFDLSVGLSPDQGRVLQKVLREVLRGLPSDRLVQAKFYLPESVATRIKNAAQEQKMSQSALVTQCINNALSG